MGMLLVVPISALAFAIRSGNSVYVPENERIDGNFYAAGQNVTVDGPVTGDVICAGQTITINGPVDGDIICAGQNVTINGTVGGSVRTAGSSVAINSSVARNAMVAGASVIQGKDSSIGWDMLFGAATTEIRGQVGRSVTGAGSNLIVAGDINGDIKVKLDGKQDQENRTGLFITNTAQIDGNVDYTDSKKASVEEGSQIDGSIRQTMPKERASESAGKEIWGFWTAAFFYSILSSLVIGFVLVLLFGKQISEMIALMLNHAGASIGWGAILMIATPIVFVILLFTIIGIPLAFVLIFLWAAALMVSKTITAILLGRKTIDKLAPNRDYSLFWAMVLGVIILEIVSYIPLFGWILGLVAAWWGLGGLILYFKGKRVTA